MKRVTIYDVAKEAGVSLATVSRVINGSNVVKAPTKERVEAAVEKLGYKPNAIAQGLALQKSTSIGLVVPEASFTYTGQVINGLIDVAKIYNYNIMLHTITAGITDINTVKQYFLKLLEYMIDKRDQISGRQYSFLLKKAKDFVEKNYMEPEISLNSVAEYIGLSPTYFSTVFKQEAGMNFIDYLTKTRIDEAKRLLRSTDKRISDIAMEVGYRDQHYFSSAFKKYQGDTPKSYRENKNEE